MDVELPFLNNKQQRTLSVKMTKTASQNHASERCLLVEYPGINNTPLKLI